MTEQRAWQRMLSGRRLDILHPDPKDVEVEDIAHGLARVSRWNGQTRGEHAFSVAQHSVFVEKIFRQTVNEYTKDDCIYALFHDAAEYVIGDIISPFKAAMGGSYKEVEMKLQKVIYEKLKLKTEVDEELYKNIKKADDIAAYVEAMQLAGFTEAEAEQVFNGKYKEFDDTQFNLVPMTAQMAEKTFLDRLNEIKKQK